MLAGLYHTEPNPQIVHVCWWGFLLQFFELWGNACVEVNDVVSGCCFPVWSTDNELQVIGYESQKMNSDYLCGTVPCMPLLP